MLHVWNILTHIENKFKRNVGKQNYMGVVNPCKPAVAVNFHLFLFTPIKPAIQLPKKKLHAIDFWFVFQV